MSPICGRVGRIAQALVLAVILPLAFLPACSSNDNGNGPPTGPDAPGAATVTATVNVDTVRLSWSTSSGATSYVASLEAGTDVLDQTVTAPTTQVVFTEVHGIEDGVTYTAGVLSINAEGQTPSTNSPTVTTNYFPWDEYFPTSLHETGHGKKTFYDEVPNAGFERFTGVAYGELSCQGCHSQASGMPPVNGRGCERCHDTPDPQLGAEVDASLTGVCAGCHGRQVAEAITHGYSDVHRDAGMDCMACHTLEDVMGDGTNYDSMLEPGAIDAACEDCHDMPASHDPHGGKLDCGSCHIQSIVNCYNCHFDTEVAGGGKIAYGQFVDWVFLLNRNGKVTTGNFQSLKWGNNANDPDGKTFIGMAPFYAHTITADGRSCGDCHNNEAVLDWADDGVIDVVTWDAMTKRLNHMTGVIPVPPNYLGGLRFDFVDQATPAMGGPGGPWEFLETGPDSIHILFGEPLTQAQMDDLQ